MEIQKDKLFFLTWFGDMFWGKRYKSVFFVNGKIDHFYLSNISLYLNNLSFNNSIFLRQLKKN